MFRRVNRPLPREQEPASPATPQSQMQGCYSSPLSELKSSSSVDQEIGRLEILAGNLLSLIESSSKIAGSTFQKIKRQDLNTDGLSIRFGQIHGKEDSLFVTKLDTFEVIRLRYGEVDGAYLYLRDDQGAETLFADIKKSDKGLKAKPHRIDGNYIIKISETEIRVGDVMKKSDLQNIDLQLEQRMFGRMKWFENWSNLLYRVSSGYWGIKPRPVLETQSSKDLVSRLSAINATLGDVLSALG